MQGPIFLYKAWVSWLRPFLWEKPSEEENDKNNKMKKLSKSGIILIDLIPEQKEITVFYDRVKDIDYCKE